MHGKQVFAATAEATYDENESMIYELAETCADNTISTEAFLAHKRIRTYMDTTVDPHEAWLQLHILRYKLVYALVEQPASSQHLPNLN